MVTYLDKILEFHRDRVAEDERSEAWLHEAIARQSIDALRTAAETEPGSPRTESQTPESGAPSNASVPRGFAAALASPGLSVISEIKRRSPSKGDLFGDLDPAELAKDYEAGGAAALSVLTDEEHFGGSIRDLVDARAAVSLPVLRKDFTIDRRDVLDARLMGADCVLLIVAALTIDELAELHQLATDVGLDVLVETHDEAEVERAVAIGARIIGVNQRDLVTFTVDTARAIRVRSAIPAGTLAVAESGISGPADAAALHIAGYDAVLVGESLVTSGNPRQAVADLLSTNTRGQIPSVGPG